MTDSYDAVVIGGGILGAPVAYHLTKAGLRTVVVDRADRGHATWAGGRRRDRLPGHRDSRRRAPDRHGVRRRAASTIFWVDPAEDMTVIFMTQLPPSGTFNFRGQLKTLVYRAIID